MGVDSWLLIFLALLLLLFPVHAAADEPPASEPEEILDDIPEATEAPPETEEQEEPSDQDAENAEEPSSSETPPVPVLDYHAAIYDSTRSIVQSILFSAFLLCGALVGLFLLRGRYGA